MAAPVAVQPTPTDPSAPAAAAPADSTDADQPHLTYLPVDRIQPNPHQPRQAFDPAGIDQLARSIRQDGLMQPVIVRQLAGDHHYELVAGERRWRAARHAELEQIPAIIRQLDDRQVAEWALVENLQREDLNPLERAQAFRNLADQFSLSHDQIAQRVGIERPTVTNTLRLLELHDDVRELLRQGTLSAGHGRALLGIDQPEAQAALARRAAAGGWSVRMLEAAVRRAATPTEDSPTRKRAARSSHLADLEEQITAQLNTKVAIRPGRRKGSGTLSIDFYDLDQFDALLARLGVNLD
jgi:ParB family chromosome partitioning protein